MHNKVDLRSIDKDRSAIQPGYASLALSTAVPKYEMPDSEMAAEAAYQIIHDELMLDGNSRLNLATFVTTWMEPQAERLMTETYDKNMIDKDEYPQTAELEMRCVNILSRLWNSPDHEDAMGTSTIGSSEAAMLGGMALKWNWRSRQKAAGKPHDKPNLVMGANVQVCWEKFCRYWEVEPRYVTCEGDRFILSPAEAVKLCDENTICVVAIMGSTYDGSYEPVKELNDKLDQLQADKGLDIPIHVDGASGAHIAPFLQPDIEWDFRVPRVKSINTSGHKYGLVYPGVGWIIWRDKTELPEDLVFHCSYLGGDLPNFALNFSRPGSQVVAQYYNYIRLGRDGYTRIQQTSQNVAQHLSAKIAELGPFELISDGSDIPVFCWTLKEQTNFSLYDLAERLRQGGWLVPAYPMPPNRQDLVVQRIVVKQGFSRDMAEMLLEEIKRALDEFAKQPGRSAKTEGSHFSH